jgi:hypothetical protein
MYRLPEDVTWSRAEVEMERDQHKPRADDWSPAHPRISVGGWIAAITLAVVVGLVLMGFVGAAIHGNGSPYLG